MAKLITSDACKPIMKLFVLSTTFVVLLGVFGSRADDNETPKGHDWQNTQSVAFTNKNGLFLYDENKRAISFSRKIKNWTLVCDLGKSVLANNCSVGQRAISKSEDKKWVVVSLASNASKDNMVLRLRYPKPLTKNSAPIIRVDSRSIGLVQRGFCEKEEGCFYEIPVRLAVVNWLMDGKVFFVIHQVDNNRMLRHMVSLDGLSDAIAEWYMWEPNFIGKTLRFKVKDKKQLLVGYHQPNDAVDNNWESFFAYSDTVKLNAPNTGKLMATTYPVYTAAKFKADRGALLRGHVKELIKSAAIYSREEK